MTTNWIVSAAIVTMSVTAGLGAQSAKSMAEHSKGDAMAVTYTGCVEAVNHGGTFLLTKAEQVNADSMRGDMAMKHDDQMMAKALSLAGSGNFRKHAGHKVSVTGSLSDGSMGTMRDDLSTLTVTSLKVIAKSCS